MKSFILSSVFAGVAVAQGAAFSQCAGIGWNGATTCVSGYNCVYLNDYYSQCQPGTATTTTLVTSTKTTTAGSTPTSTSTGKLKWLGINLSVAEFGQGAYPGIWGKDFYFPDNTAVSVR
jgi:endoglucanase